MLNVSERPCRYSVDARMCWRGKNLRHPPTGHSESQLISTTHQHVIINLPSHLDALLKEKKRGGRVTQAIMLLTAH